MELCTLAFSASDSLFLTSLRDTLQTDTKVKKKVITSAHHVIGSLPGPGTFALVVFVLFESTPTLMLKVNSFLYQV